MTLKDVFASSETNDFFFFRHTKAPVLTVKGKKLGSTKTIRGKGELQAGLTRCLVGKGTCHQA